MQHRIGMATFAMMLVSGCDQGRTYQDCILANMRGASNDVAVGQILNSCRVKFPEGSDQKTKFRDLKPWEVASLTGRADFNEYSGTWGGTLYNGNRDVTVTQVGVLVTTTVNKKDVVREYNVDVTLPPLSAATFAIKIVSGDRFAKYEWSIRAGKGL